MKASELAQILMRTPDLDVLVDGYEDGYGPIQAIAVAQVVENYHPEDYYGPYELLDTVCKLDGGAADNRVQNALLLKRTSIEPSSEKVFLEVVHNG